MTVEPIELNVEPVDDPETGETPEVEETPAEGEETPENGTDGVSEGDPESFPRSYVEKLRGEAAAARVKAQKSEELAGALWEARVASLGRLADPTDLPMPEGADPLDSDAVSAAVDELLSRKPHLASRVPRGDAGGGVVQEPQAFSLGAMIRNAAK